MDREQQIVDDPLEYDLQDVMIEGLLETAGDYLFCDLPLRRRIKLLVPLILFGKVSLGR